MNESDDIYLLRLIVQTGPVISRGLNEQTSRRVLSRLNKIVRGGIFYKIQLDWLDESRNTNFFRNLSQQEQNEYLDTLYHFASNKSDLVKNDLK